ncbi:hypothetical protein SEPCBS119000_006240 [Sporothrix epigloea]|uniref:Oxidoreductase-like protein n=1 Tax=Sporothrix epigloea TaxID=1892477 RepID=A0ABP0E1Y2_9PEZI
MRASGAVAANSLSALNLLAANPPRYPYNPTDEPRDPLTLYISRVPGTRDVILSTLKPQRKNVTSEDVAHALYYVHWDSPPDQLPAAPPQPSPMISAPNVAVPPFVSPATATQTSRDTVPRKPVPELLSTATVSHVDPPRIQIDTSANTTTTAPEVPPHIQFPPLRRPVSPPHTSQSWVPPGYHLDKNQDLESLPSYHQPPLTTVIPPPRRRQLPGRDVPDVPIHITQSSMTRKPVGLQTNTLDKVSTHPPKGPTSAPENAPPSLPIVKMQPQQPSSAQSSHSQRPPSAATTRRDPTKFVPFQLTLIRRDPSTGHQWNIGTIASMQFVEQLTSTPQKSAGPTAPSVQDPHADKPSISIHLETSGYAKFRGDDDVGRSGIFARQVSMAYTKSWTAGIRNAFKRPSPQGHERSASDSGVDVVRTFRGVGDGGGDSERTGRHYLQPHKSSLVFNEEKDNGRHNPNKELASEYHNDETALLSRPGAGRKPKGYTFTSPWEGRCEFRTGNGGRSLKCRHTLHPSTDAETGAKGGGVAGFNPLVVAQSIRDGQDLAAVASAAAGSDSHNGGRARASSLSSALSGATTVSELRFNLPRGEIFRTKPGGSVDESKSTSARAELYGRFHGHLQQLQARHRRSSSSTDYGDEVDEEDHDFEMDLTLGREHAGGGARGKRAKLGKLIVCNDGFKMLDLVVAANLGVWWVSWERSF